MDFAHKMPKKQLYFQEDNAYLSSSILGAFLETASTVYRTRNNPLPLAALTHFLTPAGRKVCPHLYMCSLSCNIIVPKSLLLLYYYCLYYYYYYIAMLCNVW